ncbi:hypothetical protein OAC91_00910 [Candidatus Marinimicrobia bacterium]|nr:hypothetical protein [Candidatus Neomarinimicrobiota bacterium]
MASLYKKRDVWYLALTINNNRVTRSLRTKDYKVAKSIKPHAESALIAELSGFVTKNENLSFNHLCERFLTYNHNWSKNTYKLIKHIPPPILMVNHFQPIQLVELFILAILISAGTGD